MKPVMMPEGYISVFELHKCVRKYVLDLPFAQKIQEAELPRAMPKRPKLQPVAQRGNVVAIGENEIALQLKRHEELVRIRASLSNFLTETFLSKNVDRLSVYVHGLDPLRATIEVLDYVEGREFPFFGCRGFEGTKKHWYSVVKGVFLGSGISDFDRFQYLHSDNWTLKGDGESTLCVKMSAMPKVQEFEGLLPTYPVTKTQAAKKNTVASERDAVKFLRSYLKGKKHNGEPIPKRTKLAVYLKEATNLTLSRRGEDRVMKEVAEEFPEISRAGAPTIAERNSDLS